MKLVIWIHKIILLTGHDGFLVRICGALTLDTGVVEVVAKSINPLLLCLGGSSLNPSAPAVAVTLLKNVVPVLHTIINIQYKC